MRTKSDGHPSINSIVAYHRSPYPGPPQPIPSLSLTSLSPTIWTFADFILTGNLPDINGLPNSALISSTNTVPTQSNLS
jgi:hypothetical protein